MTSNPIFLPLFVLSLILTSCAEPPPAAETCGDGLLQPMLGEECDDGADNGDAAACSTACKIATCGDGIAQTEIDEECDVGDRNDDHRLCTLDCQLARCGDGLLQPGETCDDGQANRWPADGAPGCSSLCTPLPYCGDGSIDPELDEECDDGNDVDDDECTNDCEAMP